MLTLTSLISSGMTLMLQYTNSRQWLTASPAESIEIAQQLQTHLQFDEHARLWRDSRNVNPPFRGRLPMVACTAVGKQKAFEILDERGYQWWRKK